MRAIAGFSEPVIACVRHSWTIHVALPSLHAMRRLVFLLAIVGGLTVARAAGENGGYGTQACLSPAETRHAVSQKSVVAPAVAIRAAARAAGGRVLRASLCRIFALSHR
jgi:hypothetical protein